MSGATHGWRSDAAMAAACSTPVMTLSRRTKSSDYSLTTNDRAVRRGYRRVAERHSAQRVETLRRNQA